MPRGTKRVRTPSAATGGREGVPDNGFRGKVHERKGYKDGVPTPMNIELFSIAMRHTATYREMDALLRQVTKKDGGHGSTFTVHKGSQDDQVLVMVNSGEMGFDLDADDSPYLLSDTAVGESIQDGSVLEWRYSLKALDSLLILITASPESPPPEAPAVWRTPSAPAPSHVACAPEPAGPTFDDAFPALTSIALNGALIVIGTGVHSHGFAMVWFTGVYAAVQKPGDLDLVFRTLEERTIAEGWDPGEDDEGEEDEDEGPRQPKPSAAAAPFSFTRTFPKISQHISHTRQKRWVEFGDCAPGVLVRAMKGAEGTVVWQNPIDCDAKHYQYGFHRALMDLEANL